MTNAQSSHTGHSRLSARFVTFAGSVGLLGAWQWLIVQQSPVSALVLAAVSGLVVGSRQYVEEHTRRTAPDAEGTAP